MYNTRLWYVIGAVVILMVVAIALHRRETPDVAVETPTPTVTATPTPSPTPTPKPVRTRVTHTRTPTPTPAPVYEEIVQQYASRDIQFDSFCAATPTDNSFLNGTSVMLDNRSADPRIVAINGVQYSLGSYSWTVVPLSADVLPATWAVDCGTAKNVAKIVLEPLSTPSTEPMPNPASPSEPLASGSFQLSPTPSPSPTP